MIEEKIEKIKIWFIIIFLCFYGCLTIYAHIVQFEYYEFTRFFWVALPIVILMGYVVAKLESRNKNTEVR